MSKQIYLIITDTDDGTDASAYLHEKAAQNVYIQLVNIYCSAQAKTFEEAQAVYEKASTEPMFMDYIRLEVTRLNESEE